MKNDPTKLAARLAAGLKYAAEKLADETIGQHLLALLRAGETLTIDTLIARLKRTARGKGDRRMSARAAIKKLSDACALKSGRTSKR